MNSKWTSKKIITKSNFNYIEQKYEIQNEIGQGGFGKVFRATKITNGRPVAVKFILNKTIPEYCLDEISLEKIPLEAALLERCQGIPGVIKLLEIVEITECDAWCIVMERNPNSIDLFDYITLYKPISELTIVFILNQLIHSIIGCHKAGVAHRDIKDENILIDIDTREIKLIDFGAGYYHHENEYYDFKGTSIYCPPEWIVDKHYNVNQLEVWSIGALLYTLITGDSPFKNFVEILSAPINIHKGSVECKDLILSCMCRDREKRLALDKILGHKLFQKYHMSIGSKI